MKKIEELNISSRIKKILIQEGIFTVDDLALYEEKDLLRFPKFGKTGVDQIKNELEKLSIKLGDKKRDNSEFSEMPKEVDIDYYQSNKLQSRMDNSFVITCPHCDKPFPGEDLLKNHLTAKDQENEKKINKIQQDYKNKEESLEKSIELKIKQKLEKDNEKVNEERELEVLELKKQIHQKEKESKEKESKVKEDLEEKYRLEIEKKDLEKQVEIGRLVKKLEDTQRQAKQSASNEIKGEAQEQLIESLLTRYFPDDDVSEIKKGARGADCILTINHKDKKNIAQIYFESKDHKAFKEEWIDKLLDDMTVKNIEYGILITTALPRNFDKQRGYEKRYGKKIVIIPMINKHIIMLVDLLRTSCIKDFENNKKKFDNPKKEQQRLWDHISGPGFQLPMKNLYKSMKTMDKLIEKEKIFFESSIARKQRSMEDMRDGFADIINSFHSQVRDILPQDLLEHKDDRLIDE
tara:strand:+ start:92 stop:1483 length:1392 start_codon:yes stop_codon:yes gene_type:complete